MTWLDIEDIALALKERHPELDPLEVRFAQLKALVLALPGFQGKPEDVNERKLEAIQMAWHGEKQDDDDD